MPDHETFLARVEHKFGQKIREICSQILAQQEELSEVEALAIARSRANKQKLMASVLLAHEPFRSQ